MAAWVRGVMGCAFMGDVLRGKMVSGGGGWGVLEDPVESANKGLDVDTVYVSSNIDFLGSSFKVVCSCLVGRFL